MSEQKTVMFELAHWIKDYTNWKIYFNQKNDEYPIFRGPSAKPDILICKDDKNYLIEVKKGDQHQHLLDGFNQLVEYAGEYYIGKTHYRTEDKENINIDGFVIATSYSKSGFLWDDEQGIEYVSSQFLREHKLGPHIVEKPSTHTFTRLLCRQWQKGVVADYYNYRKNGGPSPSKKPKIGSLLSRINSNKENTNEPYLYLNSNCFIRLEDL